MNLNPGVRQIRFVLKPAVFLLSLLPFLWITAAVFELGGLSLGPNPVESLQDFLGIWGLRFILITLAVTPLRDLLGKPWPLAFRRMLGLFAFFYCALHFLTWLILDQSLDADAIVEDIFERPFITIGTAALLLLIPLAITSTAGWRRRLGPRWQQLHWLIYPTAILICWHYYWQVKLDTVDALVYTLICAALLGYRIYKRRAKKRTQKSRTS